MKNQNNHGRNLIIGFIILFVFIFFTRKCTNEIKSFFGELKEVDLRYSNDSIRIVFEKQKLLSEKLEIALEIANKELLVAQNNSQVSETKLYNLQKKSKRPEYINELQPCNDSIQIIYEYSVLKDSACNLALSDKNVQIEKLDTIVKIQETEKANLTDFVKNLETERIIDKKQNFVEKKKKTFWQVVSVTLTAIALYFKFK